MRFMDWNDLSGKKVLILGYGVTGESAAQLLLRKKATVYAYDDHQVAMDEQTGVHFISGNKEINRAQFDFIVASPGISPAHPVYRSAIERAIPVLGDIELAAKYLHQPVLLITGTNGKTTVTLLVEHILNFHGLNAKAVGNVGQPICSEIDYPGILVIELSSFQLETMATPFADCGIILNITPDHLDRYASLKEYAAAKVKLGKLIKKEGAFYIHHTIAEQFPDLLNGVPFKAFNGREYLSEQYKEDHNLNNLAAAFLLCRNFDLNWEQVCRAYASFKKPPHRIQFVKKVNHISFYDDSKGTNIDAVIKAVQSLEGDIALIAGGVDKGSSYRPWINSFAGKVRKIYAIGEAAQKIYEELHEAIQVDICQSLQDAVKNAYKSASSGSLVLLSPGCASYDMFKNYKHRGEEYQRIVGELGEEERNES